MGFVGLNTAVSGMRAAQTGLAVTGHNMSNSEIYGYSRQRVIQKDWAYQTLGVTAYGPLKRGGGTDLNAIQQIRNEYLDINYRQNVAKLSFYSTKTLTGIEIESLMGELQGAYNFQSVINNMWFAIQELTTHPQGIETRDFFLATCRSFVVKANETYESLLNYQYNLDQQVRDTVTEVNKLVTQIKDLNQIIKMGETSGDNANDYRDERNRALDKLSELIPLEYYYDLEGNIGIHSNGVEILANNRQSFFALRYCNPDHGFVEPVVVGRPVDQILHASTPPTEFRQWLNFNQPMNAQRGNDLGILHGLIVSRGSGPAFHMGVDGLREPIRPTDFSDLLPLPPNVLPVNASALVALAQGPAPGVDGVGGLWDNYRDAYQRFHGLTTAQINAIDADPNAFFSEHQNALAFMEAAAAYNNFNAADHAENMRTWRADMHNYEFAVWSIENAMIPKTMIQLDTIFNRMVTMINDLLAPTVPVELPPNAMVPHPNGTAGGAPGGYYEHPMTGELIIELGDGTGRILTFPRGSYVDGNRVFDRDGNQLRWRDPNAPFDNNEKQSYVEVFARKNMDRWDDPNNPLVHSGETKGSYSSQWSIGNVMINPKLEDKEEGYNFLAFSSAKGDTEDITILKRLQELWQSNSPNNPYAIEINGNRFSIQTAYANLVNQIGIEVHEAKNYVAAQTVQVNQADNKRQSVMGVSLDEEMNNMMKYQYAYQGAARIFNVIDSMLDTIINRMAAR